MKKFIRIMSVLLIAIMALTALVACNDDPDVDDTQKTKYTLTVWGSQEDQAMLKEMCAAYAKAHPENEYKFLFGVQGENDAADKILNDVTSGPDVFSFPSDQINKLFAGGALARLGGEIEQDVIANNTADSIGAATLTINGENQLYAYPSTGDNCYFVYYDKRVFTEESALASLDTMLSTAEAAGKTVHFKLTDGWYLSSFFFANSDLKYDVTYDEKLTETAVSINFNNAAGLTTLKSITSYINHTDSFVVNTDDSKIVSGFTDGTCAAAISGIWNKTAIEAVLGDNMGVCKLPTANIGGEQVQLSGYMGYKLIGVNGYSQNKGEAHKLAQWLTNEQNQMLRYETRGFGPTNKNLVTNEKIVSDPVLSVVLEQAQYMRTQKGVPAAYWTPMGDLVTGIVTDAAAGTVTSDATLQQLLDSLVAQIAK